MTKAVGELARSGEGGRVLHELLQAGSRPSRRWRTTALALRRLFIAGTVSAYQSGQFDLPADPEGEPEHQNRRDDDSRTCRQADAPPFSAAGATSFRRARRTRTEAKKFLQFLNKTENRASTPTPSRRGRPRSSLPRFEDPILKPFKPKCCLMAGRCRCTRTGCRSRRPISTTCSASCSATQTAQEGDGRGRTRKSSRS